MIHCCCYFLGVTEAAVWERSSEKWWRQRKKVPRAWVYGRFKKKNKCWISTVIISVFPLPWDLPSWVTRPMFFLLVGCPALPRLWRSSSSSSSIKQPLSPHAKKMKNVRMTGRRAKTSDPETLHNFPLTFRRISFFSISQLERLCVFTSGTSFIKFSPETLQLHLLLHQHLHLQLNWMCSAKLQTHEWIFICCATGWYNATELASITLKIIMMSFNDDIYLHFSAPWGFKALILYKIHFTNSF